MVKVDIVTVDEVRIRPIYIMTPSSVGRPIEKAIRSAKEMVLVEYMIFGENKGVTKFSIHEIINEKSIIVPMK